MNGIDELVGHIGIEARLGLTDVVELVEHGVDRPGDLRHLGVGMGEVDPLVEHAGTDAAGGGRDRGQRGENSGQRQPGDSEHQRHPRDKRRQLIKGLFPRRSPQARRRRAGDEHRAIGAGDRRQPPLAIGRRPGGAEARRPRGIPGQAGGKGDGVHPRAIRLPAPGKPPKAGKIDRTGPEVEDRCDAARPPRLDRMNGGEEKAVVARWTSGW